MTLTLRSDDVHWRHARRAEPCLSSQLGERHRILDRVAERVVVEVRVDVLLRCEGLGDALDPPLQGRALVARSTRAGAFVETDEAPLRRAPRGLPAPRAVGQA